MISVGNLTTGGTGKTPMVLWIAERLLAEGKTRRHSHARISRRNNHDTRRKAETATVILPPLPPVTKCTCCSRASAIASVSASAPIASHSGAELAKLGVNWFVLDDGFQHLQLARDVDIVLIDATNPFGGGRLLPAGRLREPRSALARADIIVITRSNHAPAIESAIRRDTAAPIFYARPKLDSIHSITDGQLAGAVAPDALPKLFAFCGIGNPAAFLNDLRTWGLNIVGQKFFPDHHRYNDHDDQEILQLANEARGRRSDLHRKRPLQSARNLLRKITDVLLHHLYATRQRRRILARRAVCSRIAPQTAGATIKTCARVQLLHQTCL